MKNILITGISRGLGLELTRTLVSDSQNVVFGVSRTMTPELEQLLSHHENLHWMAYDLRNLDDMEEILFNGFIGDTSLHVFIDNAAILYKDLVLRIDHHRFENMLRTNLIAPVVLCKLVLKNFILHKVKGNIVHYSSICAHKGFNGLSMIGATKGALESFSRTLSWEMGGKGIRSNVVVIGILDIGMSFTVNESQRDEICRMAALRQSTNEQSVIGITKYLLSGEAASVTGQEFFVDAGIQ